MTVHSRYNISMSYSNISAILLAAGKGTRMNSDKPKVLHEIGGKPMIEYTLNKLKSLGIKDIVVVVGYGAEEVKTCIGPKCHFAHQENHQGGTGDAVKAGLHEVSNNSDTVMVLYGDDSAFYKVDTLKQFIAFHLGGETDTTPGEISIITADKSQTERIGRIIRDEGGKFKKTMEVWEYEKSGLFSEEVNCGVYLFDKNWLVNHIDKIKNDNDKKEYRITDILNIAHSESTKIGLFKLKDPNEWVGINTMEDLERARKLMEDK